MTVPLGVLLAGGSSRRLGGVAKGLERLGAGRVCDGPLTALTQICGAVVIAGGAAPMPSKPDAEARHVHAALLAAAFPGHRIAWDVAADLGPIGGIHAALTSADGSPVLAVAWDMPFVTADVLRVLLDAVATGAACAMPELQPGAREPLCAAYSHRCVAAIEAMVARGALAPRMLLDEVEGRALGHDAFAHLPNAARMFTSIDTSAALDEARRAQRPQ